MGFLVPISMFVCMAAVLILRPLTRQLGKFLEVLTKERTQAAFAPQAQHHQDTDAARTLLLLEHVVKRLEVMEERVDFTERLVASNQRATPQLSIHNMPDIGLREESLHSALR